MKKARKLLAMLLAVCLLMCGLPLSAAATAGDFEISGNTLVSYTGSDSTVVIPNGVTAIGGNCFKSNESIISIEMPATVTTIGQSAFKECTNLATVKFSSNLKEIGYSAFSACSSLTAANLPEGLTTIGSGAFAACTFLSSVYIPSTLTDAYGAFENCNSLNTVIFGPGITAIPANLFRECTGLTSIEIPDTVTTIDISAFNACTNLAMVKFSSNLKEIGTWAFSGCSSLTEANLPEGLTTMGSLAFSNCTSLSSVYIPSTLSDTISDFGLFSDCNNLINVTFGPGIMTIPARLFKDCTGLTSIEIPDTVTTIGGSAFSGCKNLATVSLGNYLSTIGNYAFSGDEVLADVYYAGDRTQWDTIDIGSNNEPLTTATIHYGNQSAVTPKITTENLQGVPDGVIDVPYQVIIQTNLGENMSKSHELVIESGELPQGLLLESDGELHGIPSQAGEYEFTVALKGLNSKDIVDRRSYKVKVIESTTENVAEVNTSAQGYRLLDPLPDVIDFDKVEAGTEFTFRSEGPFDQLEAVYIDGDELVPGVEYTATEGSCVITVSDMGYGGRISGRHVISATFKKPGTQGSFNMRKTAQAVSFVNPKPRPIPKYTINLDCAWGGAAIVSNKSAEAGKTVTVTAKPFYGWEISRVTAGSAKVTKNGDKYTFAMPASAVTVKVSFKRLGAAEGTGMPFFDVKTTDWFYTPVKEVYEAGLMVGTSSNAFSPNHPALRGMIAVILYSHAGSPAVDGACPFADVKAGAYYEKAVTWAKQNGVISGTSATRFSPSGKITREQLVTMLYSYAGSPEGSGELSRFTDMDKLSSWASDAMSWAVENGLISGKGNNRLDPKGNATRAEIATVLQKFMVMQ